MSSFLGLSKKEIGEIGGGKRRVTGKLDVAVIQSLVRQGVVQDLVGDYGQVIVVCDGVDAPLARLFVHVARQPEPGATGAARARSATEAFLYRCLETLPEMAGRFALNAELPIPFDGWGN